MKKIHVIRAIKSKLLYMKDLNKYKKMCKISGDTEFLYKRKNRYPILYDRYDFAGKVDGHYFFQDIYMAREICKRAPEEHFDIGSRLDGFIAHLLSFRKNITMIDIRPLPFHIDGLKFVQSDAMELKEIVSESLESLSSLHAIEHFGLGRYGDPVDPMAWKVALLSMQRVVKKGGYLYISVPVGRKSTVYFNAHRMFEIHKIPYVLNECKLLKFAYIKNGKIIEVDVEKEFPDYKLDADYLCGCYIFEKL